MNNCIENITYILDNPYVVSIVFNGNRALPWEVIFTPRAARALGKNSDLVVDNGLVVPIIRDSVVKVNVQIRDSFGGELYEYCRQDNKKLLDT